MTQIKKTLSIAGIIALATAPAMADIASTQYVQNALSSITGALDYINIDQHNSIAIGNNASGGNGGIAIGAGAIATSGGYGGNVAIGENASVTNDYSIAIGNNAQTSETNVIQLGDNNDMFSLRIGKKTLFEYDEMEGGYIPAELIQLPFIDSHTDAVAIGGYSDDGPTTASGTSAVAIGSGAQSTAYTAVAIGGGAMAGEAATASAMDSVALGSSAHVGENADNAIQLGSGTNSTAGTLQFRGFPLVDANGKIPAERLTGVDSTSAITSNKVLQFNGTTKQMQWVDAPAPTLASLLPELPSDCNTVKCALVHDNTDGAYKWEVVKVSE